MIPTLTTERLTLRAPRLSDLDAYAAFRASDRARFVGGPNTRAEAFQHLCGVIGHWELRGFGRWIVTETGVDAPIGIVGLLYPEGWPEPEIAWSMFDGSEGKGYAYEAATAARAHAYGPAGWTTAISLVDPDNTRSLALARRMGCTPGGIHQSDIFGTMLIQRHPAPSETAP
jgi:ribosomal-protein-alanine N-acetyltransferase